MGNKARKGKRKDKTRGVTYRPPYHVEHFGGSHIIDSLGMALVCFYDDKECILSHGKSYDAAQFICDLLNEREKPRKKRNMERFEHLTDAILEFEKYPPSEYAGCRKINGKDVRFDSWLFMREDEV